MNSSDKILSTGWRRRAKGGNNLSKALRAKKSKRALFIVGMLAIPVLHFLVFWVYVNVNTILISFQRFNVLLGEYEWYGIQRYTDYFRDIFMGGNPAMTKSFVNSLKIFPIQNFIILPLSFFLAYFFFKKVRWSNFFRVVFFLPSILSLVVLTMSFKYMFNSEFGPIDHVLRNIFGETPGWFAIDSPTALPMTFVFCVWAGLGYNVVLLNGAISRIPTELFESAKLDGITMKRELFQMVTPLVWPTLSTLFILGSLSVFTFYLQPMLLVSSSGGVDGNASTIGLQIFYLVRNGHTEDAATLGMLFSLLGLPFIIFIKWGMGKITPDVEF